MKERFYHIDILRAIAIVAVIVIHVFSFNLSSSLNLFIWNYLHFIIVAFLFCSGFVLFAKYHETTLSFQQTLTFYKKRLTRIVVPFYIYLAAHYSLAFLFPSFFSGLGLKFNWGYVLDSVILLDGVALNWLPLLFVMMALLFPALLYLYKKQKLFFWLYVAAGLASLLMFSIWVFPYQYYRYVMWLPWSIFFILPWLFFGQNQKTLMKKYILIALGSFGLYLICFFLWQQLGRPLNLIDNKYPPNLFYVTFETAGTFFVLFVSSLAFWQRSFRQKSMLFLSQWSYALFFVHYMCIDFILQVQKTFHFSLSVWAQLLFVGATSVSVVWLYSKRKKLFSFL